MKSAKSKLLHTMGGKTLLAHAINAVEPLQPEHLVVVVGHERELVSAELARIAPYAQTVVQSELLGTGDAVRIALDALPADVQGEVAVTYADVPLLQSSTLEEMVNTHRESANAVTVLTANVGDSTGYGRIIRDDSGQITRIVEERDATDEERGVTEINAGVYVFDIAVLRDSLGKLNSDNAQRQFYLTDVIGLARLGGGRAGALITVDVWQTEGVNDRVQLAALATEYNRRIVRRWMLAGVTVIDPATTWIDADVDLAPDVTVLPGVELHGVTSIDAGATIGPGTTLKDCEVGANARVIRVHAELAVIGEGARVGPFLYLKPGTQIPAGERHEPVVHANPVT
jgi:bifunctional UDP-N-acetylglucosamine pyrophosphorylase/glucosamine-1-phosphate N-acetyltransferase